MSYELQVVVQVDKDEPPLRPTRGGAPIVKFIIVKPGGTRVRNSSRLNSKEVGWLKEGEERREAKGREEKRREATA